LLTSTEKKINVMNNSTVLLPNAPNTILFKLIEENKIELSSIEMQNSVDIKFDKHSFIIHGANDKMKKAK
jgi:hypothetical protein